MAKKSCIECGKQKGVFSRNYAGLRLDKKNSINLFPSRMSPKESPGKRRAEFLCVNCARKIIVKCAEHGTIHDNTWSGGRPPKCSKCIEEAKLGPPPEGYDCIEAVDCQSSRGSLMGDVMSSEAYLKKNPCVCGGQWKMIVYNSPIPSGIADAGYYCSSCGEKKWFRFIVGL